MKHLTCSRCLIKDNGCKSLSFVMRSYECNAVFPKYAAFLPLTGNKERVPGGTWKFLDMWN